MAKYIMALDAGTTSNRCILFNRSGEMCSVAQKEFNNIFQNPAGLNMMQMKSGQQFWKLPGRLLQM